MLAMIATLALLPQRSGFDWEINGEDGPLDKFTMTANFSSDAVPFEGKVPEIPEVTVGKGGMAYARINVEFYVESYGPWTEVWRESCGNVCQGPPPNHASHEECDRFCDRPCEGTHKFECEAHEGFYGWGLDRYQNPFIESFSNAVQLFRNRGLRVDGNMDWLTTMRNEFISRANEKAEKEKFIFEPKHIGREPYEPCLSGAYWVSIRRERVSALIMKDLVFVEPKNGSYEILAELPMGEDISIPVSDGGFGSPSSGSEWGVKCLCGSQSHSLYEGLPAIGLENAWKSFPISNPQTGFATLVKDMSWRGAQLEINGIDMNACSFEISGNQMPEVFLPAGTILVPNENSTQRMMLMEDMRHTVFAGPGSFQNKIRLACTQMEKKEPTPATKFAIAGTGDGNLKRLAKITSDSLMRGPWDQVRVWMYTDGATYDELSERLSPMVSKPTYLFELDRVLMGGIDPQKRKKLINSITIDMIAQPECGISGLTRALPILWKKDSKKFVSSAPVLATEWAKSSHSKSGEMIACLTSFLGHQKMPEAKATARKILLALPNTRKQEVLTKGGLDSISAGVFSKNLTEVAETVEILKQFSAEGYAQTLQVGESRLKEQQ